ncbi:hypothetical protein pA_gene0025 [Vibrio phage 13VT501A]|nr:hypothetical protein pA_gene0025 [Vibrio phage 13VT501A]
MSEVVELTPGQWVELPITKAAVIRHKKGSGQVIYCQSETQPVDIDDTVSVFEETVNGEKIYVDGVIDGEKVYARAVTGTCFISVTSRNSTGSPDGLYEGRRAQTVQSYVEANSKNGVQHEGSTLLEGVAAGASNDTIFLTGALPVALKGRIISYTGSGVSAFIYEAPTYTGGTPAAYENASAINPVAGLSQIIVGATVSVDGDLVFAPVHFIGNQSNQGQGTTANSVTGERLLKPNTAYLLRLTSLDDQPQDISSYLSWYEGELDLPLS